MVLLLISGYKLFAGTFNNLYEKFHIASLLEN